ncbi:MAG: zf-HC2 domain-containing protein [Terriglobia bacterium]
MINPNELTHEYFEELCSLAALGQISATEQALLESHLSSCPSCQSCLNDFNEILHQHLPLLDTQEEIYSGSGNVAFHDASYKNRFIQRAAGEGVYFSDDFGGRASRQTTNKWGRIMTRSGAWTAPLAATAALLILGFLFFFLKNRIHELKTENQVFRQEITQLKNDLAKPAEQNLASGQTPRLEKRPAMPVEEVKKPLPSTDEARVSALIQSLQKTQSEYEAAMGKSKSLEHQLQEKANEISALRTELLVANAKSKGASAENEAELALKRVSNQLEQLQNERAQNTNLIASQQNQIRDLTDKLIQQNEKLESERSLFMTSREIRNLMGARNLHIIDVEDVDSRGTQRPFGRVFYTEGKSLLFYAYDLNKQKKSIERLSFQAWGQAGTKAASVQSLGLFQADDQTQNRWVLRCDDPDLLAKIDSVFVTIEPKGGSQRPQGQQLIYAFLKANPNHP